MENEKDPGKRLWRTASGNFMWLTCYRLQNMITRDNDKMKSILNKSKGCMVLIEN